ncbi:SGNH/GDSL hydrolase family protein [Liquorilactobacillus mali]|nr:SGNH/GDSL hydrolase family protein [Liquorilactobacillus mali]MDC7952565.1 SGNH/GDSL hydrolase family protein [Liquorilactobacillus mali]QFQ73707.1 SGNH/GDSL hydrolase family protein [Liquorilactobacillus mali]
MEWQTAWVHECSDFSTLPFKMAELTEMIQMTLNVSGNAVRFELSNLYGDKDIVFDEVSFSTDEKFHVKHRVCFDGKKAVVIKKGTTIITDSLDFVIQSGMKIFLKLVSNRSQKYMDFANTYDTSMTNAVIVRKANTSPSLRRTIDARRGWFCLSKVEVLSDYQAKVISIIGDSLVEMGYISDSLMALLYKQFPGKVVVLNYGISGQRMLNDAPQDEPLFATFGVKTRKTLPKVLQNKPSLVLMFAGLNDLILPVFSKEAQKQLVKVQELFTEVEHICEQIKMGKSQFMLSTVTPFEIGHTREIHTSMVEQNIRTRIKLNELLQQKYKNELLNTAELVEDNSLRLLKQYDLGDHMHVNKAAGEIIAQSMFEKVAAAVALD